MLAKKWNSATSLLTFWENSKSDFHFFVISVGYKEGVFFLIFLKKSVLDSVWGCIGKFRWNRTEAENSMIKYDLNKISVKGHASIELFSCVLWKWNLKSVQV